MRTTWSIVVLLIFLLVMNGGCLVLDRQFIYFPEKGLNRTPEQVGLDFEDVYFFTSDGLKLHGWLVAGREDVNILWFHGNAGNISHRLENLVLLHEEVGASVFLFDYRGYGLSEGSPSEDGLYLDAEAAFEYMKSRSLGEYGNQPDTVFYGRSLGAAVAVELAIRYPSRAVILESPFPSIKAMVKNAYPFLPSGLLVSMFEARFESDSKIDRVRSPLMVIHGDSDTVVPASLGKELYERAVHPKRFYLISGADHNDTYLVGGKSYFQEFRDFIIDPD